MTETSPQTQAQTSPPAPAAPAPPAAPAEPFHETVPLTAEHLLTNRCPNRQAGGAASSGCSPAGRSFPRSPRRSRSVAR
ncbi:hypothetical protein ACFQX6_43585 [Streptosporangium lutulentum]